MLVLFIISYASAEEVPVNLRSYLRMSMLEDIYKVLLKPRIPLLFARNTFQIFDRNTMFLIEVQCIP